MSLCVFSHHCHGVGGQQLLWTHGCGIGHVGKHINKGDQRDGDEDRTRQIPKRMDTEIAVKIFYEATLTITLTVKDICWPSTTFQAIPKSKQIF